MAWSGKLVGGLIGGMLGGPLGAGIGATMGHVFGDGGRALELLRLDWQQHAFRESGPGLVVTPVFVARGLAEAMSGSLTVEDTPTGGLTFLLDLPAAGGTT